MLFNFNNKHVLVFLLITAIAFLVYAPSINAPFTIEDEYDFLDIANGKVNYKTGQITPVNFIDFQRKFIELGRYAPFSASLKYFKAIIFPNSSKANHIILVVIAVFSTFLFFLIFREFQVSIVLSTLGAFLYLFAPFATINIRLSTGESPGNLMLFLSILLILKHAKYNTKPLLIATGIAVLFMSQCKESYTLMVPVLACIYIGYYAYIYDVDLISSFKKKIKVVFIMFGLPFMIGVLGILFAIYVRGNVFAYGGTSSYSLQLISNFIWLVKWTLPLLVFAFIAMFINMKKKLSRNIWIAIILLIIWIGSQVVSYYNISISYSQIRYLTPGSLILVFFPILSIHLLYKKYKLIYYTGITVIVLMLVKNTKITYIDAGLFNANARAYNKVMDYVAQHKTESIAFYQGYEIVNSSLSQLKYRGFVPKIYASTTKLKKEENKEFNNYLLDILRKSYDVIEFDSIISNKSNPKMLIVSFPLPDNKEVPDDLIGNSFTQRILFTEKFTNLKLTDLIKPAFYKGELMNDSISYVAYLR